MLFDEARGGTATVGRRAGVPPAPADVVAKLARLREHLRNVPRTLSASRLVLQRMAAAAGELVGAAESRAGGEVRWWARGVRGPVPVRAGRAEAPRPVGRAAAADGADVAARRCRSRSSGSASCASCSSRLDDVPTLADVGAAGADAAAGGRRAAGGDDGRRRPSPPTRATGSAACARAVVQAAERAAHRLAELRQLAARCTELADIDYEFLYDRDRHLLAIGYNVGDHRLDASFYDLLASEARLASFVAIAQGKLPQEHWFGLGRLLTTSGGRPALLSWSGSMFEYLMPLLVMPTYDRTLLDETYRAVVDRQIAYGRERGVPWGVSESGYSKTDAQLNYQYRAFGVPGLGFKRGLADDLVIAPYASAMGLMVDPEAACANLRRLAAEGQLGAYGFYEAIDYTPARLPRGQESVTVRSFMVHHQGMAFLSLAYLLLDRPMQRRFASDPAFRATDLLLQERVPKDAEHLPASGRGLGRARHAGRGGGQLPRLHDAAHAGARGAPALERAVPRRGHRGGRRLQPLARPGRHALARGPDARLLGHVLLPPRRRDAASSGRRRTSRRSRGRPATRRSTRRAGRSSAAATATSKRTSRSASRPRTTSSCAASASPTAAGTPRTIELTSFAEVVLAPPAADAAHPAFSNLFVQTELVRARQAILCTRRPALRRRAAAVDDAPDDRPRHGRRRRRRTRPAGPSSSAAAGRSPTRRRCTAPR